MTTKRTHRTATFLAAIAATIGVATVAWAAGTDPEPAPQRAAAVVADVTTPAAAVARAVDTAARRGGVAPQEVVVRRTGGSLEAIASVAALASDEPAVIAGVGPDARSAVGQAESTELAPDTAWLALR